MATNEVAKRIESCVVLFEVLHLVSYIYLINVII